MQSTLAVISLEKIRRNLDLVLRRAQTNLYAVVKDDAYGHGAEAISLFLEPYVYGFAVATIAEGAALRVSGITKEILVLTPCLSKEEALSAFSYALTPTASSKASLSLLVRAGEAFGFSPRAQLKINTGMNRYGVRPARAQRLAREAQAAGVTLTGVYSHFYAPECEDVREEQFSLFRRAGDEVKECFPKAIRHLSATGGILAGRRYNFDAVRCGIALYGYLPQGFSGALAVRPAMKLYAAVSQSGAFLGGGVGYQRAQKRYKDLSVLRLGYGDGLFRGGGIGNESPLCMDACLRKGSARFAARRLILSNVEEYAKLHGTIVYEALVNIGKKAEKIYV